MLKELEEPGKERVRHLNHREEEGVTPLAGQSAKEEEPHAKQTPRQDTKTVRLVAPRKERASKNLKLKINREREDALYELQLLNLF